MVADGRRARGEAQKRTLAQIFTVSKQVGILGKGFLGNRDKRKSGVLLLKKKISLISKKTKKKRTQVY